MDHPHVARIFEYYENNDYFCFVRISHGLFRASYRCLLFLRGEDGGLVSSPRSTDQLSDF